MQFSRAYISTRKECPCMRTCRIFFIVVSSYQSLPLSGPSAILPFCTLGKVTSQFAILLNIHVVGKEIMSHFIFAIFLIYGVFADYTEAQQPQSSRNTSISTPDGCKLYAKTISLKKVKTRPNTQPDRSQVNLDVEFLSNVTGDCANRTGTIEMLYENVPGDNDKIALTKVQLIWTITYQPQYQWWEVVSLELEAQGPFLESISTSELKANWSGSLMKSVNMGASKTFSYACSKPDQLLYTKETDNGKITYGLQFINLHLQPFKVERGRKANGFTDNVDDCVAFFSAGAWMTIFTCLILLSIFIFGVVMMSNLNTPNRFDDPKGKSLAIIEKE